MKRLILCSGVAVSVAFLTSCSGDPTGVLRNGVAKLNSTPSQLFLQQGKTGTVVVTATDGQGNQVETAFGIKSVGPGLIVGRDPTFRPVFVNDSQLAPPATDAMFRYTVTASGLVGSTFTITADGKDVIVPVNVTSIPGTIPAATVTSTGTPVNTPTVLAIAAPYQFPAAGAFARFDAGDALVVGRAADGSTLTVLAPPGTTSTGNVSVVLGYLPTILDSTVTATPITVDAAVPALAGTGTPGTAPDIAIPPAGGATGFFDAGTFTGADITGDTQGGFAQYYKLTIPADGDYTITTNWNNDADVDQFVCADAVCTGGPTLVGTGSDQPESGKITLTAGTHYLAVVLFAAGTPPPPSGKPAWISISLQH